MNDTETEEHPVGELYFDRSLYGDDMIDVKSALEDIGFELQIAPLADRATLYKVDK